MWRQVWALALGVALATPAHAQWMAQKEENPFTNSAVHAAITANMAGTAMAIRCDSASQAAEIVFVTNESADGVDLNVLGNMNRVGLKLLVIVDKDPRVTLNAQADVAGQMGDKRLRLIAGGDEAATLAKRAATAKQRIAVAFEMMGKIYSQATFEVTGSKRVITGVLDACKLSGPAG